MQILAKFEKKNNVKAEIRANLIPKLIQHWIKYVTVQNKINREKLRTIDNKIQVQSRIKTLCNKVYIIKVEIERIFNIMLA